MIDEERALVAVTDNASSVIGWQIDQLTGTDNVSGHGSFYDNHSQGNTSNSSALTYESSYCDVMSRFVINSLFAGSICILGIVGNLVSFLILQNDKNTPIASFLLRCLALADSFFLLLWFLQFSIRDLLTVAGIKQEEHVVWMYIRLYSYPLLFVGQTMTMWVTVLIAAVRYLAVCWPYKALELCQVPTVRKTTCFVVLGSFVYNIPRYFEAQLRVILHNNSHVVYSFERTALGSSEVYTVLYFDILYYCFNFVLPLIILAFLSAKLTIAYRLIAKRRTTFRSARTTPHHDPNITLIMIIVVLVFMLCNAPARIVQIIWAYRPQTCLSVEFLMMELSNVLEVLNSSTNFIIYCVFRRQFRQILHATLCQYRRVPSNGAYREQIPMNGMILPRYSMDITTRTALVSEC